MGLYHTGLNIWRPLVNDIMNAPGQIFRVYMKFASCLAALALIALSAEPPFPRVWVHYTPVSSSEVDFTDLKAHGVGLVNVKPSTVDGARKALADARRYGMQYGISFPD